LDAQEDEIDMSDGHDRAIPAVANDIPELLRRVRVPGLSIALVQDAMVTWVAAFGLTRLQPAQAVTLDTVFQAASLSKPLFASAVLGLAQRGQLDLDAPLTTYLSDPYVPDDPLLPAITARRVLCHMTGWPNWRPEGGPLVRVRAPGETFGYSGEGYNYLQAVVERIVGQPLDTFMQEAVLGPLGMDASTYRWAAPGDPRVAQAHDQEGQPRAPDVGDRPEASSSLHTTPSDYARFLCAMLISATGTGHAGAPRLIDMLQPQISLTTAVAWGLGWGLEETTQGLAFWHWGDNPGYKSLTVTSAVSRTGIMIMTNGDAGLGLCASLVRAIIGGDHPAFDWLATTFYDAPTLAAL